MVEEEGWRGSEEGGGGLVEAEGEGDVDGELDGQAWTLVQCS